MTESEMFKLFTNLGTKLIEVTKDNTGLYHSYVISTEGGDYPIIQQSLLQFLYF